MKKTILVTMDIARIFDDGKVKVHLKITKIYKKKPPKFITTRNGTKNSLFILLPQTTKSWYFDCSIHYEHYYYI